MIAEGIAEQVVARLGAGDPARLAGPLARALDEIRRAWPGIELVPARLAEAIATRLTAKTSEEVFEALEHLRIADVFLADACAHGDARACAAFLDIVDGAIAGPVGAITRRAAEVDDVRQVVCERLLVAADGAPRIARYSGEISLRAWVRVIATRIAIDHARRQARNRPLEDALLTDLLADHVAPDLAELKAKYRLRFKAAVEAALLALSERDRGVLRFTIEHGLTADQVGRLYSVHRVTVARWIRSIRESLVTAIIAHLGVERSDLDSMLRLIRSQVSLSVQRLLDTYIAPP
jgi:RNA polymerase sigma-70 factor (ECF subfamily)